MDLTYLRVYLSLDENGGTDTAVDSHTSGIDLDQVTGTPSVVSGILDDGRSFDAATLANASNEPSFATGRDHDWTIAFWVKVNVFALTVPGCDAVELTDNLKVNLETSAGPKVTIYGNVPGFGYIGLVSTGAITNDDWVFVAFTYEVASGDVTAYQNAGVTDTQDPAFDIDVGNDATLTLGEGAGNGPFALDEFALFVSDPGDGGCLDATAIAELYGSGTPPGYDGLGGGGGGVTYDETGSGGLTFGGSAGVSCVYNPPVAGGVVLGGSASPQTTYTLTGSGSLVLSGSADVLATHNVAGSGGIVLAGAASVQETCNVIGSGQLALSGTAVVQATYSAAGTGTITIGGSAVAQATYTVTGSGGIVLTGQAQLDNQIFNETGEGGIVLGGSAAPSQVSTLTGSGGLALGGAAVCQFTASVIATGGLVLGGSAIVQGTFSITGSGGLLLGGTVQIAAEASIPCQLRGTVARAPRLAVEVARGPRLSFRVERGPRR